MHRVNPKERLSDGVRALFERSGLTSEADLAQRADLPPDVVNEVLAGRRSDLESTVACLRGMGADLRDLLRAMNELAASSPDETSSPVSHLTGLRHIPRPVDLLQDSRRLLSEARKLVTDRSAEDLDRTVAGLRQAVDGLENLVASDARRLWNEAEDLAHSDPEEPISDQEFERALGLLRSLVMRATSEIGRPTESPARDQPEDRERS